MQLCHTHRATSAAFDDPNLVLSAGLVTVLALTRAAGLHDLVQQHLTVPSDKGANAERSGPPEENRPHRSDATPHDVLTVIASWSMGAVRSAVANMLARGGTADHPTAWHTLMTARRLATDLCLPRRSQITSSTAKTTTLRQSIIRPATSPSSG